MRKKILEKRLARLQGKKQTLTERAMSSQDVNEVRNINSQIEDVNAEIAEVQEELEALTEEERQAELNAEKRDLPPADAKLVNGDVASAVVGSFATPQTRSEEDFFGTMEYRQAFKSYIQTGKEIEYRDGAPANTVTLGAIIPTTVMNELIDMRDKVYGNLYAKVRKLNVKGAVKYPIANLQARAKWVSESTVSPRQDGGEIKDFVEFSYNTLELRVSQSLLSSIVALDVFEREIVKVMFDAYVEEMDKCIINGTGNGQMLGILNDTRVMSQSANIIELTAAEINNWTAWRKKFWAKVPAKYRRGEFIFTQGTTDAYLETMADSNNNPIFRQATGLEVDDLNMSGRFFGKAMSIVESDVIPDFDSAEVGDVIGIYWQPRQYAINTNMAFGMRRYFDEDANEWVDKMLTIVDGKVLNPKGFYIFKKK